MRNSFAEIIFKEIVLHQLGGWVLPWKGASISLPGVTLHHTDLSDLTRKNTKIQNCKKKYKNTKSTKIQAKVTTQINQTWLATASCSKIQNSLFEIWIKLLIKQSYFCSLCCMYLCSLEYSRVISFKMKRNKNGLCC